MQRRKFLQASALAAATFHIVPRHVLGGPQHVAPSERINIALIGAGGRGRQVLRDMLAETDVRAIAVADPAESFSLQNFYYRDVGGREPTKALIEEHYRDQDSGHHCTTYVDFHEMLDQEKDLDAVVCATPDHLHAYITATCLKAGKHVYCEKPLTHNIFEARAISKLSRETGLATQMGNQGHSTDGIRETCEWLWAGAIGDVQEVHTWVSGHRWNPTLTGKPIDSQEIPTGLDWDRWLGPRSEREFNSAYFPVAWRDFWAFGNSNIGDFACHDLDAACWALDLRDPSSIDFNPSGPCNEEIGPHGCIGYYHFPANEKRGAIKVTWYDGGLRPEVPVGWPSNSPFPSRGILFKGSEGVLFCGGAGGQPKIISGSNQSGFKAPEQSIRRVKNHARDWLDAVKGGETAGSNFEYGANLTEIALLGALSLRTGQQIQWDAQKMQATNNPAASKIVREEYREGWQLPS